MTDTETIAAAERRITAAMERIIGVLDAWRAGPRQIAREDARALAEAAEAAIDAQHAFGDLAEAFLAWSKAALEKGP